MKRTYLIGGLWIALGAAVSNFGLKELTDRMIISSVFLLAASLSMAIVHDLTEKKP